ncbi:MAG: M56 family metallopeptidase [Synergistaceae bacterium]|nr:M56 family metallopeptidase [Synergistaceae bacterium]
MDFRYCGDGYIQYNFLYKIKAQFNHLTPLKENIYLADHISTPFVLGVKKPKIYLPSSLLENEQNYIIRHELCHIKRLDHITRTLGFIALSVHWFNPLVWIAFALSGKDMELSCDEAVMKSIGTDIKAEYSQSLLRFSTTKKMIHATPLAFGEGDTKSRVKNVLNYKRPKFWMVLITALLCVVAIFCLVSNPAGTTIQNPYVQEYVVGATGILGSVDTEEYTEISEDFVIGADKYGRAVFKDPHKAFATFETLYADTIELIKSENDLKPFSHKNYEMYKVYGIQMGYNEGDPEMLARCVFVSRFLDIYENSFDKTVPNTSYVEPTVEVKDTEPFISKVANGTVSATLENEDLAKQIVMNSLAISAAFEGVDIDTLDNYYHIHYLIAEDSTRKDYYAFLLDGRPVLQFGKDGRYVRLNDELYDELVKSFQQDTIKDDTWGITLSTVDVTPKGLTIAYTQKDGAPTGDLQTGSHYWVEKYQTNKWVSLMHLPQEHDIAWTSEAWRIPTDDTVEWKVDWQWIYGKLSKGSYRIGKSITDFRKTGDYDEKVYYAVFEIE